LKKSCNLRSWTTFDGDIAAQGVRNLCTRPDKVVLPQTDESEEVDAGSFPTTGAASKPDETKLLADKGAEKSAEESGNASLNMTQDLCRPKVWQQKMREKYRLKSCGQHDLCQRERKFLGLAKIAEFKGHAKKFDIPEQEFAGTFGGADLYSCTARVQRN
jgi:hypothetical protein